MSDDKTATPPLDIHWIMRVLPHRYPFLLVDRILELAPGKRVVGIKNVTINEEFFLGHFPGHPVMPGVLILEAMAQTGGCMIFAQVEKPEEKLMYLAGVDKARFRRPVVPGDQLVMTIEVVTARHGLIRVKAETRVEGQLCCEAELLCRIVERNTAG